MSNRAKRGSRLPDIKVADTERGALMLQTAASRTAGGRYYLVQVDGANAVCSQQWAVREHKRAKGLDPERQWPAKQADRRPPHGALEPMSGAALRAARTRLGLTQQTLGDLLGISNVEVWRKEAGQRPITRVQALALRGLLAEAEREPGQ